MHAKQAGDCSLVTRHPVLTDVMPAGCANTAGTLHKLDASVLLLRTLGVSV